MALAPTTAAFHRHIDLWFDHAMCGLRADCYPTRSRYARLYGLYRRDLWHWRDWQYPWYAAGDADSEAFQLWADYHWLVMGLGVIIVPIYSVTHLSYRLALTPDELQGRVNSVFRLIAFGSQPLGLILTGALLQAIGPIATVVVLFVPQIILAVAATLNPGVRNARRVSEV